jgi:hypothetical protein
LNWLASKAIHSGLHTIKGILPTRGPHPPLCVRTTWLVAFFSYFFPFPYSLPCPFPLVTSPFLPPCARLSLVRFFVCVSFSFFCLFIRALIPARSDWQEVCVSGVKSKCIYLYVQV